MPAIVFSLQVVASFITREHEQDGNNNQRITNTQFNIDQGLMGFYQHSDSMLLVFASVIPATFHVITIIVVIINQLTIVT